MDKFWLIHLMEYSAAVRLNELLLYATMQTNLAKRKRSQIKKVNTLCFLNGIYVYKL